MIDEETFEVFCKPAGLLFERLADHILTNYFLAMTSWLDLMKMGRNLQTYKPAACTTL